MPPTTTTPRKFRTHPGDNPVNTKSPLFDKLCGEWVSLNTDPNTTNATRRLGQKQPALAEHNTPGDIVDAIDAADHLEAEIMISALLESFQDGDQIAGRILLQQFLPFVASITRAPRLGSDTQWIEDRRHIAIAELWHLAATIDIDHYRGRIVCTFTWRLRHRAASTAADGRQIPWGDSSDFDIITETTNEEEPLLSEQYRLAPVLAWAHSQNIITQPEVEMLTIIYIEGNRTDHVAAQMGLKPATVSQRCHRAVKRIQAHVDQIPEPAAIA